jgi:hypothetical protein
MVLKYESKEFSDALVERLNTDYELREKAKGMNLKTLVVVDDVAFAVYTHYENGKVVERRHLSLIEAEAIRKDMDFVMGVPTYDLSVAAASGKESFETLFMNRKVKLEGSILKALPHLGAMKVVAKITAQLVSESVVPPKDEFVQMLGHEDSWKRNKN